MSAGSRPDRDGHSPSDRIAAWAPFARWLTPPPPRHLRSLVSRLRLRVVLALAVLAVLALIAVLVPLPDPAQLRTWALAAGPAAPILLFICYSVVTVAPVPRTVFTLAAGLLL